MTPVPEGASLPTMIRCVARAAVATRSVWSAVFTFPHWTISTAMSVATSRSISAGASEVVPPLMWPTTSGLASRTTSASMGLEPAIEGPPVWIVTVIPCALAQRTIGAAAEPDDRSVPDHQRVAVQERAPDVPAHELADVSNERLHTLRYALRRERSASRRANGPSNLICPFSMM